MSGAQANGVRAVLTDIEGTTSSIAFVKDVLFPYAREHLPRFVEAHRDDPAITRWLDATAREAGIDDPHSRRVIDTLLRWIDEDRKATPL
jgi:enolase-phosphatase E1